MDAVEEIKRRVHIEDVIGEYVELKRSGRNFKGLSPFNSEKTPSFMVSPDKQIWHDFSSNKGGTMFGFIMEMEGVDFRGALEILARKAGIDLSEYGRSDGSFAKRKKRLLEALSIAARYYQHCLTKSPLGLEYVFKKRNFTRESVLNFQLGYAPGSGRALVEYLRKKGFTDQELRDTGLAVMRRDGLGDMFRGRLMVPLSDAQGAVVGFTARQLVDDPNAPKYINTPQTIVYDKGRQVFGLHLAKDAMRREKFVVIVEGNLDVIASHQAGVANVVAAAGTALTMDHLKSLARFTPDIRLSFDQDKAGVAATERAIPMAQSLGVTLSIIDIPSGKDPDELIRQDVDAWRNAIADSRYVMDWLFDHYVQTSDIATAKGKAVFSDHIIAAVRRLQDPVEQEHYLRTLAEKLGVSLDSVKQKYEKAEAQPERRLKKGKAVHVSAEPDHHAYQDQLLGLFLFDATLRSATFDYDEAAFTTPERRILWNFLIGHPDFVWKGSNHKDLHQIEDYVKLTAFKCELLYRDLPPDERREEVENLTKRLIRDYQKRKTQDVTAAIRAAEERGDLETVHRLLSEFNELLKRGEIS